MRYGLADVRNYDSVELARSLDWFAPLYEPRSTARTSRRDDHLGRSAPRPRAAPRGRRRAPSSAADPASRRRVRSGSIASGAVWVARLDGRAAGRRPRRSGAARTDRRDDPGLIRIESTATADDRDRRPRDLRPRLAGRGGRRAPCRSSRIAARSWPCRVPPGGIGLVLRYDPPEVRAGVWRSRLRALAAAVFALTGFRPFRSTRIIARGAWTDPSRRVRIGFVIFTGLPTGQSLRDETLMVHFTCDLCGKDLTASGDPRYVVKIEAYPGFDPTEITEDDLDDDHMEAVSQLLQRDEGLSSEELAARCTRDSGSTSARPATSSSSRTRWARNSSARSTSARTEQRPDRRIAHARGRAPRRRGARPLLGATLTARSKRRLAPGDGAGRLEIESADRRLSGSSARRRW